MKELLKIFGEELGIPVIDGKQKVWFFRTSSGSLYNDFYFNEFIALGWDKMSAFLVKNSEMSWETKRALIHLLYPEEKRPGLILGQLDTFYNKMKNGDMVIIPSPGSRNISIGVLGDIIKTVIRNHQSEEYERCNYSHKRSVRWLKTIDIYQDVYLFRAMRAQQTISDVTGYSNLIYRNLFPFYISQKNVHFTMQKTSNSNYSLTNNVELLSSMLSIIDHTAGLYNIDDFRDKITVKTAVGSPGFIEVILPFVPVSAIISVFLLKSVIGKERNNDGSYSTGILAIIDKVNNLVNDHKKRRKIDAEINLLNEQAYRERMEALKIESEIDRMKIENKHMMKVNSHIEEISDNCSRLEIAAKESGITCAEIINPDERAV